ncbi:AHH domain-containing protein [Corallococcus sp. CA053C]|uniref:AHH domain-containing protein n=1 Tax=Corallococcus sp. CA053C TaxID=2316732 RepID=UPI0013152262|nr:AHH domain-containing protein [Corallococcus sp. CA053C]
MANDGHINGTGKLLARLKRSRDYRRKGYSHIKGDGGRKSVYADLDVIQAVLQARGTGTRDKRVKPGSRSHARRYTFAYGMNFQSGRSPYSNQGHHLLPEEALSPRYLSSEQLRMIQGVDYDINNGENIIFLPVKPRDTEMHRLPYHSGSHPNYTRQVDGDMAEVKDILDSALAKDKEHKQWNPPADIKNRLMGLQSQYWDLMVAAGPIAIDRFVKPGARKLGMKAKAR